MKLIWTKPAATDLLQIVDYVGERSGALAARKLRDKLLDQAEALKHNPLRCRIVPELRPFGMLMYRELIVRPYRMLFRVEGRDVILLAVFDGRRDLQELILERAIREKT